MVPELSFGHLATLSTPSGLYEHAVLTTPRRNHGFCLDDVARGLVVTSRAWEPPASVRELTRTYLRFVVAAQDDRGRFHNRRSVGGAWTDEPSVHDHWGRAIWGLGTAANSDESDVADVARGAADIALRARSPWPRATAYAALGAYELLRAHPGDPAALTLLADARVLLGRPAADPSWPWPHERLTYANAVLPEALIVIGAALDNDTALSDGLRLLEWLVEQETNGDHLSVTPVGGWQRGEPRPGFDQQPIEVSALAEACWRAFELTGDPSWAAVVDRCVAWFLGANDAGLALYDPRSGGGRDGLHRATVNQNQGAESSLAALATFQLGRLASATAVR
jgi:hypothetical protein